MTSVLKKILSVPILLIITFAVFFSLESLVNHYFFRTQALDLGMANNALYDFSRFHANQCTLLFETESQNFLSCHFTLYPLLLAPFRYIFGSYTLLIFQILAILWGGWGVYSYFKSKTSDPILPNLALLHFFLIWGIYSALSFDYHDNVIAAMLVPWIFYHLDKKNWWSVVIYFLLFLVGKENMGLWAIFLSGGLFFLHRKSKTKRSAALIMLFASLIYFIVVIQFIMPYFEKGSENLTNQLSRYSDLGDSWLKIISSLFTQPKHFFTVFFTNTTGDAVYNGIKAELFLMVFLAGGWALFFRPSFLLMLIPVFAQKMLSREYGTWGINGHYSIEFVPILTIACFMVIMDIKNKIRRFLLPAFLILFTGVSTFITFNGRTSKWYEQTNTVFFRKSHYQAIFPVKEAGKLINLLPEDAAVSAHSYFIPHLALRDKIYSFPRIKDATFILVLSPNTSLTTWPQTKEQYRQSINDLYTSKRWEVRYHSDQFLVFEKKP